MTRGSTRNQNGELKEVSAEFDAVGGSRERKEEPNTMVEGAATDEKQEERYRGRLRDRLAEFRKRKDEEDEARCLIEEMQRRNLDTAQSKSYELLFGCTSKFLTKSEDVRKLS